jgi:hypothetical protein
MGVSYSVFIGPFIEAPDAERPTVVKYNGCGTDGCKNRKKESTEKFCPSCGQPIKQCERNSLVKPSQKFDYWKEFNDRIVFIHEDNRPCDKQDVAVFMPNQGKFGQRFEAYDCSIVALDGNVIAAETTRFNEFFAKDIARIREVFGKAEVKWGAIAYTS